MSEPLSLPEVERSEIAWRNELAGTRRQIAFQVGDVDLNLTFLPAGTFLPAKRVVLSAGSLRWEIGFSDWDRLPFVEHAIGIDTLTSLPDDIARAVLESLFEPQLNWLADRLGVPCELAEFVSSSETQSPSLGFRMQVLGTEVRGSIHGETAAMAILQDMVATVPKISSVDVSKLPISAPAEIGRTAVQVDELRGITVGDVVIIDQGAMPEDASLLFHFSPGLVWKASVQDERIIFDEPLELPSNIPPAMAPTVTLAFESGRIQLTAGQLAELQSGMTIPRLTSGSVAIVVEDQPVAEGELVSIGERNGVRVTKISGHWPHAVEVVEEMELANVHTTETEPDSAQGEPV